MTRIVRILTLVLALLMIPSVVFGATYVFPYEGFRYTPQENEIVLTQTNLAEYEELLASLGTSPEAVLANYLSTGVVMEVIEDRGQIAVSVVDSPFKEISSSLSEMSAEEAAQVLSYFEESGLYETCDLVAGEPDYVRLTTSAMFASMPVYSIRYVTLSGDKMYTLNLTVIGRSVEEADEAAMLSLLSGMKMFAARTRATTEPTITPVTTPEPEEKTSLAKAENTSGNLSVDAVPAVNYEGQLVLTGSTEPETGITVKVDGNVVGEATATAEGTYSVRVRLPQKGDNRLEITAGDASAEMVITYMLPLAEVTINEPTESEFTGSSILLRGTTVPDATVYFNGDGVNTNVKANRNGAFSIRLTFENAGTYHINIRSHMTGYTDFNSSITLTRKLTEREELAAFRLNISPAGYEQLKAEPERFADAKFIFRGRITAYTDYNGRPCALVHTSNPSTGNWRNPIYIVIDGDTIPPTDSVVTFYVIGEGITLPVDGQYSDSGVEEEIPVTVAFYLTTDR